MPPSPPAQAFLPARRAPLFYFAFAHACLLLALALVALRPVELGGFYYHPRLVAVVHLVTLGFVTSSILGALYLVCPLAFRMPLPESRMDLVAALSWTVGVSGIASHFWIERYSGMAWAGGLALLTPAWLGGRVLAGLRHAPVPLEARLPVGLAIVNLYAAGGLGVLLGIHKHQPFLPFSQLAGVHAHLHLAAVGFATLLVVGAGFRMLPMTLPAAMPRGAAALASSLTIEAGVLALAVALVAFPAAAPAFAVVIVAGIALFLSQVGFMLRHRRPAPSARRRPDWSVLHVLQAIVYLVLSAALGLWLAVSPPSDATLRAAMAYGVFGLVGFLCQMVIGVEARLVPLAAWLQAFAAGGYAELPASQHEAAPHAALGLALGLWTLGVPCLAAGLAFDRPGLGSAGALSLAAAVSTTGLAGGVALWRLRPPRHIPSPRV